MGILFARSCLLVLPGLCLGDPERHRSCRRVRVLVSVTGAVAEERNVHQKQSGVAWSWQGRGGYAAIAAFVQAVRRCPIRVGRPSKQRYAVARLKLAKRRLYIETQRSGEATLVVSARCFGLVARARAFYRSTPLLMAE